MASVKVRVAAWLKRQGAESGQAFVPAALAWDPYVALKILKEEVVR